MKIRDIDSLQRIICKLKTSIAKIYKLLIITLPIDVLKFLALKGSSAAQIILARRYYHGKGINYNKKLVKTWLTKAAMKGNSEAKKELGFLYFSGEKFKKDWRLASKWLIEAYHEGEIDCAVTLGYIYEGNRHFHRDAAEMLRWHKIAAESGDLNAQKALVGIYTKEKKYINPEMMMHWLHKAADQNDKEATYLLGHIYLDENHYDVNEAIKWLKIAAKKKNHDALVLLGDIYSSNKYHVFNYNDAILQYDSAIKLGSIVAMGKIGSMYQYGLGCDKDIGKAIEWYSVGVQYNDPYSQFGFAQLYRDDENGMMDLIEAFKWSYWAKKNNHPDAEIQFKEISDKLTEQDINKALRSAQEFKVKPIKSMGFTLGYTMGEKGKAYR
ncbi:tetratricopeptide repeat protein [Vibrio splendidus]